MFVDAADDFDPGQVYNDQRQGLGARLENRISLVARDDNSHFFVPDTSIYVLRRLVQLHCLLVIHKTLAKTFGH